MKKPEQVIYNNSLLANALAAGIQFNPAAPEGTMIRLNPLSGKKADVETILCLSCYADRYESLTGGNDYPDRVGPREMQYYHATMTLYVAGNVEFTATMLAKSVAHRFESDYRPSRNQVAEADRMVRRMACIGVGMDCEDEMKIRAASPLNKQKIAEWKDRYSDGIFANYLLPVEPIDKLKLPNGAISPGWRFYEIPALHDYGIRIGSMIKVPLNAYGLYVRHSTNGMPLVEDMVIRRLIGMRTGWTPNRVLSVIRKDGSDGAVLEALRGAGYTSGTTVSGLRKQRLTMTAAIADYLDYLMGITDENGIHYLNGYEVVKKGKTITGFDLKVDSIRKEKRKRKKKVAPDNFVYKYVVDGETIYVGQTVDVDRRIAEHSSGVGIEEKFLPYLSNAEIFVHRCATSAEMNGLETLLIDTLKPRLNVKGKTDAPGTCSIDEHLEWVPYKPEA